MEVVANEEAQRQRQEIDAKLQELQLEQDKTEEERKRADALRAAYNADKQALVDKISELDKDLQEKTEELEQQRQILSHSEQNEKQQRSELNFWNGKVTNMRRDLDF